MLRLAGPRNDLLLRQTDLLTHLTEDEAAMLDKGYDGIQNDYPKVRSINYKARRNHPLTEGAAFTAWLAIALW